jgi:mutator protein MutT
MADPAADDARHPAAMRHIAAALLFDRSGKLLVYLRDDKPTIPFPNHWDFFGGHVEPGETPEQALVREVKEEIGYDLRAFHHFRDYACTSGDAYPNTKHIYYAKIDALPEELTLHEGQYLKSIDLAERGGVKWANILGKIVDDFTASGLTPR